MAEFANVDPQQNSVPTASGNTGNSAKFIPQLWSDEVIAAYKTNIVLADLIKKMSMKGKKGDTIHVPKPGRSEASAKVAETSVTLVEDTATELLIIIDQHFEYSQMIEDMADVQALSSMRRFYTDDAGYALAKNVDTFLFNLGKSLGSGDGTSWVHDKSKYWDATSGYAAYAIDTVQNVDIFNDAFMRRALQELDDSDTPMQNRFMAIPPSMCNTMRGIDRYVSSDYRDNRVISSGQIGTVYDVPVYVTTNCPILETTAENGAVNGDEIRGALLAHRDAMVLAEQVGVRSQTQYKQEHLSTLYTADRLYGGAAYQENSGVVLAVPNAPTES